MSTRNWEDTFRAWSRPASESEDEKRDRTEQMIREAIGAASGIPSDVRVFAKGSYKNNTNVRLDSDVDIGVEWTRTYFYERGGGAEAVPISQLGIVPATEHVNVGTFKNSVRSALESAFGRSTVERKNRCIAIREGSRLLQADVVPCFQFRLYWGTGGHYYTGTVIYPDDGSNRIRNYDDINHQNGVTKNEATGRRYKSVVRIIKRLENELVEKGATKDLASWFLECLVWNVTNDGFGHSTSTADVRSTLAQVFNNTMTKEKCGSWKEVNDIKFLFHATQRWNRGQAHDFAGRAWDSLGFE